MWQTCMSGRIRDYTSFGTLLLPECTVYFPPRAPVFLMRKKEGWDGTWAELKMSETASFAKRDLTELAGGKGRARDSLPPVLHG